MSRFAVLSLSLALLAGCTTPDAYQGKDYTAEPIVRMNVSDVSVENSYAAPQAAPNVEHQLAAYPADVLGTALTNHYRPERIGNNSAMKLRFSIREASVVEEQVVPPSENFFDRVLGGEIGTYRYNGRFVIETTSTGPQRRNRATLQTEITRTLETTNVSEGGRKTLVGGMVEQMVDEAIAALDQQINEGARVAPLIISGADQQIDAERSGRWDHVMEDRVARSAGMRVITTK